MKFKSIVRNNCIENKIKWIEIETDETDTGGVFLYYFESQDLAYDTWHKTLDEAYEVAYKQFGIKKEEWIIENS